LALYSILATAIAHTRRRYQEKIRLAISSSEPATAGREETAVTFISAPETTKPVTQFRSTVLGKRFRVA
jgi:hypothetical protein